MRLEEINISGVYDTYALDCVQKEFVKAVNELYSIRHPETPQNVRVIYTICDNVIILLTAFSEKNTNDYRNAIKRADKKWLEKE